MGADVLSTSFAANISGSSGTGLVVTNEGNVGIGKITPGSKLEIYESTGSKPGGVVAATKTVLKLSRSGTTDYSYGENAEFRIGHGGPSLYGSKGRLVCQWCFEYQRYS